MSTDVVASTPLAADDPMLVAFKAYYKSAPYANTKRWAVHPEHVDGSLWAAFCEGWEARAAIAAAKGDA